MIVVLHSGILPRIFLPVLRLAVPLFFMMSSYFYYGKVSLLESFDERKNGMIRYTKRIGSLYLFWTIALLPFLVVLHWGTPVTVGYILKTFFITGSFGASWFLLYSIYSVILLFILSEYLHFKNRHLFLFASALYVIALLSSNYGGLIGKETVNSFNANNIRLYLSLPAALIWFVIGKVFAETEITSTLTTKSLHILILITFVLYYGEYFVIEALNISCSSDCYILSLPLCIFIFGLFLRIKDFSFAKQKNIRKMSIIIYCSHKTILGCLGIVSFKFFYMSKLSIFLVTLLLCAGVIAIIAVLDKTKAHKIFKYAY